MKIRISSGETSILVEPGTVCFWTERPKLANPRQLAKVRSGSRIRVERA
jgi:hypothetical protein